MSRFPRLSRFAAVAALAVSTVTVFTVSPAGAATGSLAAASNGFTVTYNSSSGGSDFVALLVYAGTHSCANLTTADFNTASYDMYGDTSFPASVRIAPSPATYTFGSVAYHQGATTIAAGSYSVCLISFVANGSNPPTLTQLGSLSVTITDPGATTTTTTTTVAPAPTTTAASGGAATPAFTG